MAFNRRGNKSIITETISNVSTNMIEITEDKLELIVTKHFNCIKKSSDWIGSAALVLSLVGMYCTSTFHAALGLSADFISAIFFIITLVSVFYLVYTIYNAIKNKTRVKDIINDIKGEDK